jgi:zinc-ribbon domain
MLTVLFFWFAFTLIVAIAAHKRNRSGFGWFLLSAVVSPLVAGLALVAVGRHDGPSSTMRKCPACAELVKREANICKHCGSELQPMPQHQKSQAMALRDERWRQEVEAKKGSTSDVLATF